MKTKPLRTPTFDPDRVTTLTFDCYGTLIDWEGGIVGALRPLLARHGVALPDDEVVMAARTFEAALCKLSYRPYRAVLAGVVKRLGRHFGFPVGPAERDLLAASVPSWQPFPDTADALRALGRRYRLAVIANMDDDLFAATARRLGMPFDLVVTAEQARCYKPHRGIFKGALRRLGAEPGTVAHVAGDAAEAAAAMRLGCAAVWVRRSGRPTRLPDRYPNLEVPSLQPLLAYMGAGAGF